MRIMTIILITCLMYPALVSGKTYKRRTLISKAGNSLKQEVSRLPRTASLFRKCLEWKKDVTLTSKSRLLLITPGPFAKYKVMQGKYPECYPARFSVKFQYKF